MWTIEQEAEIDQQYQQNFDEYMERGRTRAAGYNKSVRDAYDVYWNRNAPGRALKYRNYVGTQKKERLTSAIKVESAAMLESGNRNQYDALLTAGVRADVVERSAYDNAMENYDTDVILAQGFRLVQQGKPSEAFELMSTLDKETVPTDRLENYNKILGEARTLTTQSQTDDMAELNKMLAAPDFNTTTALGFVLQSSLPEDKKTPWITRFNSEDKRRAEGVVIDTHEPTYYKLNDMATNIWRGASTKAEFDVALNEARFPTDGSEPKIDDEAYRSLGKAANQNLKTTQAESLSRSIRGVADVVLGERGATFEVDEMGNITGVNMAALTGADKEDSKFYLNWVNRYANEMRQWIADNPTKSGQEFYVESERKKYEYWDASIEDIKAKAAARRENVMKKLPHSKSEEEVKALKPGTLFVAPNGKRKVR